MNMGSVELYRINNEYNFSELISHFDTEYIIHTLEDKLENINYASSLIEPNLVGAFESNFKMMRQDYPGDGANIMASREEIYREIIRILCEKFNLEFNTIDPNIDPCSAAYYLYDFLVCNRNANMVHFFTMFIINNKENLYRILTPEDLKKNKDSSTAYSKRVYADAKYGAISANINKIINCISTMDIKLINIIQSVYVDPNVVYFMDSAFKDRGNFFKDYYCNALINPDIMPIIITDIRLKLQSIVGDASVSHIDEIITSSNL